MGWLSGPVAVPETKAVGPQAFGVFGNRGPDPEYPGRGFLSYANAGFGKNELVYSCVMEKATSLPESPLRVYGPDGLGEPRSSHPLRRLLAEPNPVLSEYEMFELLVIHMDLAGIAFWEIVRDRAGRPVQLWPLRPDLVRFARQRDGQLRFWYALPGSGALVDLGTDVLVFKYPNPVDPLIGQPPLRSAVRAVAMDNEATDFVKVLLQNHAVPGVVITTQRKVDEDVSNRLAAKWKQKFGGSKRGEPAILQSGMDVKTLGLDLTKLEFPDLRTISETRICSVFGVPPILVGAKAGLDRSTFANYSEARRSFWEETLMPLQRRIGDVIRRRLLPMVNETMFEVPRRVTVKWDRSEVLALKESEQAIWERANQALRAGAITVNDFRRIVRLPLVPGGDVFLRPAGVTPTQADGTPTADPDAVQDGGKHADLWTGHAHDGGETDAEISERLLTGVLAR
ncbi:phage portal protein [Streptomyces sp. NPDC087568]|uniref:phage portal protein n=1 Tax=Streptomyces sp. NPDC087568 TaxID=3365799 RepID=UPI003802C2F0